MTVHRYERDPSLDDSILTRRMLEQRAQATTKTLVDMARLGNYESVERVLQKLLLETHKDGYHCALPYGPNPKLRARGLLYNHRGELLRSYK